ncbi:Cutinase transcription factor 1 beta [Pseudocercospora fuligena]|uniref:Cutinase transcription factor 1 beta n=1 Tax=Pseudocercospora fuligena TaxID=685502 RepID=A0A8H6RHP3_9PEZI|nr:Cutinase transcription factor 1 beta [Pseudocercospora fuligena]
MHSTHRHPSFGESTRPSSGIRKKSIPGRAKKACSHCQVRKIRCDVVERSPCSNCVDARTNCVVVEKKGPRAASREASPSFEHKQKILQHCHTFQLDDNDSAWDQDTSQRTNDRRPNIATPSNYEQAATTFDDSFNWSGNAAGQEVALTEASGSIDLSHLADLHDVFRFTRDNTVVPGFGPTDLGFNSAYVQHLSPSASTAFQIPGLSLSEAEYLGREGCLDLPPMPAFLEMARVYFLMVHPNLPIIAEDEFWSLWNGEHFTLGNYSFLLVKAMVFASINFMELETFLGLGFASKREARVMYYRQSKTLFDVGVEKDPIACAQACLLLSYYAPTYNTLRVNSYWLGNSIRFARIARADIHYRLRGRDRARSRLLKRLWWGVQMRDRILALGLRRRMQLELIQPPWQDESSILQVDDFEAELGRSHVHDLDTQHRIVDVLSLTCRLMQCLFHALTIYRHESLDERLETASSSLPETISNIQSSLRLLRHWQEQASRTFPSPIALDDAHESRPISIYANMMFIYHSAAIFALNEHLILLHQAISAARGLFSLDDCREDLETANLDMGRRVQEFVQVRLMKYLPISVSAFHAIPLVLQAINVAAARGTSNEGVENRRLEIFTRTLKGQQENFDGSDFCADVLSNLVAYAQDDEKFISSMINWRDGKETNGNGTSLANISNPNKVKLDWTNLVQKRPKLFLRLMLYLDFALCTGAPPQDDDFPLELRRDLPGPL